MNRIYFNKYPSRISFMFLFCVLFVFLQDNDADILLLIFLVFLPWIWRWTWRAPLLFIHILSAHLFMNPLFPFKFETVYMVDLSSSIYDWLRTRLLFVFETWRSCWWNGEVFSKSDSSINFLPWSCALKFKAVTFSISTFCL